MLSDEPYYDSDLYGQASRELYHEFVQRYNPEGGVMTIINMLGYCHAMWWVQAVQAAGSTDTDKVMKVVDDPSWRFDWFGEESWMGGIETFGIRRAVNIYMTFSEIIDGKVVPKTNHKVVIP